MVSKGNHLEASLLLKSDLPKPHEQWMQALAAMADYQQESMQSTYVGSQHSYETAVIGTSPIGVLMLILGALVAVTITKSITRPLRNACLVAEGIASGDLTGNTGEQIESGALLVNHADGAMEEIVNSVTRLSDIMSDITHASEAQSDGIEQVNHAIVEMDELPQQNAALVEQSAAAAESMKEQALHLLQTVSVFRCPSTPSLPCLYIEIGGG